MSCRESIKPEFRAFDLSRVFYNHTQCFFFMDLSSVYCFVEAKRLGSGARYNANSMTSVRVADAAGSVYANSSRRHLLDWRQRRHCSRPLPPHLHARQLARWTPVNRFLDDVRGQTSVLFYLLRVRSVCLSITRRAVSTVSDKRVTCCRRKH